MKTIQEDIRTGSFHNVYLIMGDEGFLRKDYKDRLLKALLGEGVSPNFTKYVGKDVDVREVISTADTPSFFASKRVLLLEDIDIPKEDQEKLAEYLKHPYEESVLLFVMESMDKRSKLYKAIDKAGHVAVFNKLSEKELEVWVQKFLRFKESQISAADAALLVTRVGTDMGLLRQEMEKLLAYTMDRGRVTREDIDEIVTVSLQDRIFDMFSAITARNQEKALTLYYDLLGLKVPVIKILVLLGRQYTQLLHAREAKKLGYTGAELARRAGVKNDFVARKLAQTAESYTSQELKDMLREIVEADEAIKTGRMEERMAIEILIVHLSAGAKGAPMEEGDS